MPVLSPHARFTEINLVIVRAIIFVAIEMNFLVVAGAYR
jgi:hypothetical protein